MISAKEARDMVDQKRSADIKNLLNFCDAQVKKAISREQYQTTIVFGYWNERGITKTKDILHRLFLELVRQGYEIETMRTKYEIEDTITTLELNWKGEQHGEKL